MSTQLVTIARFDTPVEAEMARLRMEEQGISVTLSFTETGATLWRLYDGLGVVRLDVPEQDAERAVALIAEMRRTASAEQADANADSAEKCLACGEPMSVNDDTCPHCGWSFSIDAGDGTRGSAADEVQLMRGERPASAPVESRMSQLRSWKRPVIWLLLAPALVWFVTMVAELLGSVFTEQTAGSAENIGENMAAVLIVGALIAVPAILAWLLVLRFQR